jgi:diguanylate cyclase (GGDEF)-like protein
MPSQIIEIEHQQVSPTVTPKLPMAAGPVISLDALAIPLAILDIHDGTVVYANSLFRRVIPKCRVGEKIAGFFDEPCLRQSICQTIQDNQRAVFTKKIHVDNNIQKLKIIITECLFNHELNLLITVEHSIEEKIDLFPINHAQSNTLNRAHFMNYLGKLLEDETCYKGEYCLCSIDIDHFRIMNEKYGYEAGNFITDEINSIIKSELPEHSLLCRMGSNDYALLFKDTAIEDGVKICEKICSAVRDYNFVWKDNTIDITLSIGIVPLRFGVDDVNSSLSYADTALRTAQDNGRDRVHNAIQEDTMMYANAYNMQYVLVIENDLKKNSFELYAQPIVSLDNPSSFEYYEILLRSFNAKLGVYYSSQELIQAAETFDIITKIDQWVCTNVFDTLQKCLEQGRKLPHVSINISGQSIVNSEFENFIKSLVGKHTLPTDQICFEITESVAVKSIKRAKKFILNMRELGFKFALDDFGVGYCSFNYLQQLDVDVVKIDGVFVSSMLDSDTQYAMVKAIADVAQAMQIKTVAEYVDSPEVIKALTVIGVDYGQGYIFGKPQPIDKYLLD